LLGEGGAGGQGQGGRSLDGDHGWEQRSKWSLVARWAEKRFESLCSTMCNIHDNPVHDIATGLASI
jgi:hypothetical protein